MKMINHIVFLKLRFLAGVAIVVCYAMLGVASADNIYGFDSVNIGATCPPAICSYSWDGLGGPVSGSADFTPAGLPWTFSFETAPALTEQCTDEYCIDRYGYGGIFSMTGPDGVLTGIVTSGDAFNSPLGAMVEVNFFGQWTDGSYLYGYADVKYLMDYGQFSASLRAQPTPEPSSLLLFGSGIFAVARMFRIKRKS
jgi:hypothetical protein